MDHVTIFSTGKLWEIDMAREALSDAHIPHFTRQEELSGLASAFPAEPSPGVGVTWCLLVPKSFVKDARARLANLPIELDQKPGVWNFTSHVKSIKSLKLYALLMLIVFVLYLIRGFLSSIF